MATFNVSPETLNCNCCKNNGHRIEGIDMWFCSRKEGFVSSVVKELILKRMEIKKRMKELDKSSEEYKRLNYEQFAIKTISNAMYGSFAFHGARWYCYECAQFLAAAGRYFIRKVIEMAEKEGFVVLYGDTDSVFLKYDNKEKVLEFLERVNSSLPGLIELDLQGFYRRGIFIPRDVGYGSAKKRYALVDEEGKILIRGLESVRRDWCRLAKDVQRKVIEIVLVERDVSKAVKYVKDVIERVRRKDVKLRDVVIYEQITKPLNEYRQLSPHISAAKKLIQHGVKVSPGDVIMYIITSGHGSISARAYPVELADVSKIDVNYYIEHQVIPAAMRILKVLGVKESELKACISSLDKFL
jgi:DNA polymerase I/DNA polymerase-2